MSDEGLSASERFAKRLISIEGVKYFVLARKDGQVITHNLSDPDDLAAMTTLCGLQAEKIRTIFGFSSFQHLVLTRTNQENLLLFQLDKYFLSVVHKADTESEMLLQKISNFLKNLTRKTRSG